MTQYKLLNFMKGELLMTKSMKATGLFSPTLSLKGLLQLVACVASTVKIYMERYMGVEGPKSIF